MTNERVQAKAAQIGASDYVQWMIDKLGPALAELLLDVMMKRSEPSLMERRKGVVGDKAGAIGGFDVSLLIVTLFEKFGPQLITNLADTLDRRGDTASKLIAVLLQNAGPQLFSLIMSLLQTPQGAQAVAMAMEQAQKDGEGGQRVAAPVAGQLDISSLLVTLLEWSGRILADALRSRQGGEALRTALNAHFEGDGGGEAGGGEAGGGNPPVVQHQSATAESKDATPAQPQGQGAQPQGQGAQPASGTGTVQKAVAAQPPQAGGKK